jgi:ATP-dependent helicase IRC3
MVRHTTWLSTGSLATTQPPPEDVKVEEGEEEEEDDDTEEPGFKLRGYQEAAVQACLDAIKDGWTRVGVSSPTGSGKTLMFASLLPHFIKRTKTGRLGKGKVLIVVGSEELGYQAEGIIDRLEERYRVKWVQGSTQAKGDCNV